MQTYQWFLFLLAAFLSGAQVPPSGCTLKSPLPAGNICGVQGSDPIYGPTPKIPTYIQQLQSVTECRDFCLRRPTPQGDLACLNFRFNSATSRCYYSGRSLLSITPNPSSTTIFYNSSCFDCPPKCPQTPGVNLFDNPGFELSQHLLAPWGTKNGTSLGKIVRGGAYGNSARSFQSPSGGQPIGQNFVSCPGVIYEYGFDYRAAHKGINAFEAEVQIDGGVSFIRIPKGGGNAKTWRTYTNLATFNQLNNGFTYLPISFRGATIQVDNLRLTPTTYDFKTVPGADNIFVNGGFETGSVSPWIVPYDTANVTVVSPGISSGHALQFKYAATDDGNYDLSLQQNLTETGTTIIPGKPYLLSMGYTSNVPELTFSLSYNIGPNSGTNKQAFISQSNEQPFYAQNGTAQMAFTGQENATYVELYFDLVGSTPSSGGLILLDNISIKELALPA